MRASVLPTQDGFLSFEACATNDVTALRDLRMSGALSAGSPKSRCGEMYLTIENSAQAIGHGAHYRTEVMAGPGARLSVSTEDAKRVLRAAEGASGRLDTRLAAGPGAQLSWFPHEIVMGAGARLERAIRIEAAPDACVLTCDTSEDWSVSAPGLPRARIEDDSWIRVGGETIFRQPAAASRQIKARAQARISLCAPDALVRWQRARRYGVANLHVLSATDRFVAVDLGGDTLEQLRNRLVPLLVRLGQQNWTHQPLH